MTKKKAGRPVKIDKRVPFTIYVEPKTRDQYDEEAEKLSTTRSAVARRALMFFIDRGMK